MSDRGRARRARKGRRRRGLLRGAIKTVFWTLVLAGVFILGIGYGATVGGGSDDADGTGEVTITQPPIEVQATLPTVTETVTRTVTTKSKRGGSGASKRGAAKE